MKLHAGLAIALLASTSALQASAQSFLVWTQCIADRTDGQQRAIVNAKTAEQCAAFSRTCEGANFKQSNFSTNPTTVRNPTLQPCYDTRWPDAPGANGSGKCIVHFRQGGERRWIPGAKSFSECSTMAAACAQEKGVDNGQPIWNDPAMALPSLTCPINQPPQASSAPRRCYMKLADGRILRVDIEPVSNCRENANRCGLAKANEPKPAAWVSNEPQNEVGTCTASDLPRAQRVPGSTTGPVERGSFRSGLPAEPPNMAPRREEPAPAQPPPPDVQPKSEPPKAQPSEATAVLSENQCPHNISLDIRFLAGYDVDGKKRFEDQRLNLMSRSKSSFSTIFSHSRNVQVRIYKRQPGEVPPATIDAPWETLFLKTSGKQLLLLLTGDLCG